MKWPPSKCWTSPEAENGNRHFLVKNYGGKGAKRWVELFPTKDKKKIFRISFKKLNSEWISSWITLKNEIE